MRRNHMLPLVLLFFAVALSAQRPSPEDERAALVQRIDARRANIMRPSPKRSGASPKSTVGVKGMMVAAKTMALTTVDLFTDPAHIQRAKAEFDRKRGPNFVYKTRLADRKPALDSRK